MATTTMNVKLLQIVKTTADWNTWDSENYAKGESAVKLSAGLLLVEDCGSGVTRVKVGNGTAVKFADLEYISYPTFGGANGSTAGSTGFVPAPSATDNTKFLRGDGTWANTPSAPEYTAIAGGESGASSGSYDQVILQKDNVTISTVDLGLFADSASGKDEAGKIKSALLPSYVDDIIEGYYNPTDKKFYTSKSGSTYSGEITPQAGVIYVDLDTDGSYRWSGSAYINISNPIDAQAIYDLMDTDTDGAYSNTKHGLVPAYGEETGDDKKILRGDGWASLTAGTGISVDDTTTAGTTAISIAAAGASTLGGVSVATNSGLTLNEGAIAVNTSTGLTKDNSTGAITLTAAGTSDLGGVSVASNSAISNTSGAIDVKLASDGAITKNGSNELQVSDFTGADGTKAGTHGLVKAPAATDNTKFLRGDGTWQTINAGVTDVQINSASLLVSGTVADIAVDGTYDASTNKVASETTVRGAITALVDTLSGTPGASNTITAFDQVDGKVSATFGSISITKDNISDYTTNFVSDVKIGTTSQVTNGVATISEMGAATSGTAGSAGLVPAPSAGDQGKVLTGGKTWADNVNDVTYDTTTDATHPTLKVTKNGGNATAIVTVTDNASATALSGSSTNLVTERTVANAGFAKGARVSSGSGTADLGLVSGTNLIDMTDLVLQCTL